MLLPWCQACVNIWITGWGMFYHPWLEWGVTLDEVEWGIVHLQILLKSGRGDDTSNEENKPQNEKVLAINSTLEYMKTPANKKI